MLYTETAAMRGSMLLMVLMMTSCVDGRLYRGCQAGPVCYTKSCISVADELLTSIDAGVDPCEDFYHYACGGWSERKFLIPKRQSEYFRNTGLQESAIRNMLAESIKPTDLDAEKKAKRLYASCLNHTPGTTEDAAIVRAVTDRFGRWPVVCGDCNVTEYDLKTFLVEATQIGVHPLFMVTLNPFVGTINYKLKTLRRLINIGAPELGLNTKDYASFNLEPEYRQIYADTIYAAAKRFGIEDHDRAKQDAMEIVKVEEAIAKISPVGHRHSLTSLDKMDEHYVQFMNWTSFVTALASLPSVESTHIHSNEMVYIEDTDVLNKTMTYFLQLPARTQVNYIIWRVVDSLQSVLLKVDDKLDAILEHAVSDNTSVPMRDQACANFVLLTFHLVAYRQQYREHLPDDKLRTVNAMVNKLKDAFKDLLTGHDWLDEDSSQIIEEKIESITTQISFFREAMNTTFLEAYYSNIPIDENNFINNVIAVRKDIFAKNLHAIMTYTKLESPYRQSHSAYMVRQLHEMYFTSYLLQDRFFFDNAPLSFNYAGTGFVLGHEVFHTVDRTGVRYHRNGTYGDWLSNATNIQFLQRVQCLIDQFNTYFYKPAMMHLMGQRITDENIADNGGMKLAYKAYKNYTSSRTTNELKLPSVNFTNDQVFFLRAAQVWCQKDSKLEAQQRVLNEPHSPAEFKVNGALQNLPDFADAFGCQLGTPMNPVKKCVLW